ncbi:hypothetical protein ACFLIM_25455 [Nonomuraea sp. M3C6]|uniref:Coenzyme PQQ synthesis protein A n=1 Tax=Nonomuraea marmarensis TaxID=3351344 RepID=A0ABW7AJU6_9ACTN
MSEKKSQEDRRPTRDHARCERGQETIWHKPAYQVVEASMEMSAYFLADR